MTVQAFINLVYRDLVVIYSGQTPSTDQSNDALSTLNEILASWSHEGLLVPTHAVTTFALTAGTSLYTMGVGATWVTAALPIKVKGAISSLTGIQQGMAVMPMGEYETSIENGMGLTAVLPKKLGIDNAAPMRNVILWPTPSNSSAVVQASYWMALTAFATLGDSVAFALPAFELAVRNELAIRLAGMHQKPVTQDMIANAQSSKLSLARIDPSEPPTNPLPKAA
jgi:hypothetical protein